MNRPLKGFITYSHEDAVAKDEYGSVANFERLKSIQLPSDIATMLTPGASSTLSSRSGS